MCCSRVTNKRAGAGADRFANIATSSSLLGQHTHVNASKGETLTTPILELSRGKQNDKMLEIGEQMQVYDDKDGNGGESINRPCPWTNRHDFWGGAAPNRGGTTVHQGHYPKKKAGGYLRPAPSGEAEEAVDRRSVAVSAAADPNSAKRSVCEVVYFGAGVMP